MSFFITATNRALQPFVRSFSSSGGSRFIQTSGKVNNAAQQKQFPFLKVFFGLPTTIGFIQGSGEQYISDMRNKSVPVVTIPFRALGNGCVGACMGFLWPITGLPLAYRLYKGMPT